MALPFWPPAWASVISAIRVALLFTILSNNFPMLLANVMPLSFEHFPLVPLPLYSRVMFPFSHWGGISLFLSILLNMFRYIYLVALEDFVKIPFGILSGPGHFLVLRDLMVISSSFIENGVSSSAFSRYASRLLTVLSICLVHLSYSGFPSRAW